MKNKMYNILKGTFLVSDGAFKNWRLIFFFLALAIIMIASSHGADSKVHKIARLNEQVKAFRSTYVETRAQLMALKMESKIRKRLSDQGIKPSTNPPFKIVITSKPTN
ncbi:FtsL-like putative cell division protein [Flavobacteriaceae bacterium]|jgi:hypothetical protein|nr:FtsL-like putative cell division protein [Flavobacteriaceae bacterium]MDC1472276.1 FtsL-like putative cell division protein [Flavobacteriaceae bacterium]